MQNSVRRTVRRRHRLTAQPQVLHHLRLVGVCCAGPGVADAAAAMGHFMADAGGRGGRGSEAAAGRDAARIGGADAPLERVERPVSRVCCQSWPAGAASALRFHVSVRRWRVVRRAACGELLSVRVRACEDTTFANGGIL